MGWISQRRMFTGHGLNPNPSKQRKGPLKKITYYITSPEGMFGTGLVRLECDHIARVWNNAQDRARCSKCAQGLPADPPTVTELSK